MEQPAAGHLDHRTTWAYSKLGESGRCTDLLTGAARAGQTVSVMQLLAGKEYHRKTTLAPHADAGPPTLRISECPRLGLITSNR